MGDHRPEVAFTWLDVLAGGVRAWMLFMALLLVLCVAIVLSLPAGAGGIRPESLGATVSATGGVLLWVLFVGGVASLCVMSVGLPLAWLFARVLRRTRSVPAHVVAWAVFGLLVGPSVVGLFCALSGSFYPFDSPALPISAALTGVSVLFGWWRTFRAARRELLRDESRSPADLNRAFAEE